MLVTHNMEEVGARAERVAVLNKGRLALQGTPREVFNRAEELLALGLDLPAPTALMRKLREAGILTSTEAEEEIAKAMLQSRTALRI